MVRSSYRREIRAALTYPLAAALAEGAFTGVVATKYFHASPILLAVITAAPMFGNIMALLWAELAKTRRMVPFVNVLQLGVVTSIALVAFTRPLPEHIGGWVFAGLIILARVLASGIVTIRASIWRHNYPRQVRGQIIGRITMTATAVLALATFLGAWWLDRDPSAYVWLYPMAAALGVIGIWQLSGIRVRGEGKLLKAARARQLMSTPSAELAQTDESEVLNYEPQAEARASASSASTQSAPPAGRPLTPAFSPEYRREGIVAAIRRFVGEARQILRDDKRFRVYQWWQFMNGAAFMMMVPPTVFLVSRELTEPRTEYLLATVVLQIVPMVTSIIFTQLWSPLFDRVHITVFRVAQGFVSTTAQLVLLAGALTGQLWVVAAAQFVVGVSNAAGNLAWNLGHNDFAPPEKSASYMAVHVMLTGLRGFIAPFVGVMLFNLPFVGNWVFAVTAAMCFAALCGFYSMARTAPARVTEERVAEMTRATGR